MRPDYSKTPGSIGVEVFMKALQAIMSQADKLLKSNQATTAAELYRKALELSPEDASLWSNLGNALCASGQKGNALGAYARAVDLCPDNPMMRFNLGSALLDESRLEEAEPHLEYCARAVPDFPWVFERLGLLHRQKNNRSRSLESYDRAVELRPNDAGLAWRRCLAELSICYAHEAEIDAARESYAQRLAQIVAAFDPKDPAMAASAFSGLEQTPFYLAYQGKNDTYLQRLYGTYVAGVMQALHPRYSTRPAMPAPGPDGRWRIGFVSRYFVRHSVWKLPLRGWLENLDRERFHLFGYATTKCPDSPAKDLCGKYVQGERSVEELAGIIAEDRLHALIFPEIGMDWKTICLAALRLAPLQLAGAGHPETTGLATVDFFLSSQLMEPSNASEHYTEKLALLPNLSSCNHPSGNAMQATRTQLGLPDKGVLYFTPQSLFKYLPRYDDIYARIAREVPHARFLFLRHESSRGVTASFRERIQDQFRKLSLNPMHHVFFLPRLTAQGFTAVCEACDVFLDSMGWSGNNTSLEAIWQGLPVVTMPGELMRSRHAAANLAMTNVTETVCATVDDYVQTAIRLGLDAQKRDSLRARMYEARHGAFGDQECIRALEALLEQEITRRRSRLM